MKNFHIIAIIVIPAKAGIQSPVWKSVIQFLDPRFREDDKETDFYAIALPI